MREIKFRGKSTEGGWVYGSYFDSGEYGVIYSPADKTYYQCYLESIGQYTGLKDKNDSEIYEGDIVSYLDCEMSTESGCGDVFLNVGSVAYDNESMCFFFSDRVTAEMADICISEEAEVIGNIYENPELLGGDGK